MTPAAGMSAPAPGHVSMPPNDSRDPRLEAVVRVDPAPAVNEPVVPPARHSVRAAPPPSVLSSLTLGMSVAAILAVGVGGGWMYFRPSGVAAQAALDAEGNDSLAVACPQCADGTRVHGPGFDVLLVAGRATARLPERLHVGENRFPVKVERTRHATESVDLVVPLAYRVENDLHELSSADPAIVVHVEAVNGTAVRVANTPLELTPQNSVDHRVPLSAETEGFSLDEVTLTRKIPYGITLPGKPAEEGTLDIGVRIIPLAVRSAGAVTWTAEKLTLHGKTLPGATVVVEGRSFNAALSGEFHVPLDALTPGTVSRVEIVAMTRGYAARHGSVQVRRVESLEDVAKEYEGAATSFAWDKFEQAASGTPAGVAIVEGAIEAVEDSPTARRLRVAVERGCGQKGSCVANVLTAEPGALDVGARIRAYGKVVKFDPGTPSTAMVDAEFVLVAKGTTSEWTKPR
jgi:hypothetical protein